MLVLQRRKDESIIIGDDIEIYIADIKKDCVRISINAPRDVQILRKELIELAESNKEASQVSAKGLNELKNAIVKKD